MKPIRRRTGESGSQLVELALILPILVFMSLMVSEGAGIVRAHIVLNNAAREGARFSSLPENHCALAPNAATCTAALQNVAVSYAGNNGITLPAGNVTVSQTQVIPVGATVVTGSLVSVTYQYSLTFLPAIAPGVVPATVT